MILLVILSVSAERTSYYLSLVSIETKSGCALMLNINKSIINKLLFDFKTFIINITVQELDGVN